MANKAEREGRIKYATVLRLDCKDVQALAKIASGGPEPKVAPARAKRPRPHEV